MAGDRTEVLILEDDPALKASLVEFFTRQGITVHATAKISEAMNILDKNKIGTLFADCLMPEQSGVEFVLGIRSKFKKDILDVVLMSGIFTDPTFVKESLQATNAKHFLKKPFDLNELMNFVEKPEPKEATMVTVIGKGDRSLYSWIAKDRLTLREKRKALESVEESYGFDLPFIYNFIVQSKMSGHLNVIEKNGDVSGITFCDGFITGVDIPDKSTFLGKLILDQGYSLVEDIDRVLKIKSSARFGERLIQGYAASPHAVPQALAIQMSLRLSKTIIDQPVKLNFAQAETTMETPNISKEMFMSYLHDWVGSKLTVDWLRINFVPWNSFPVIKGPAYSDDHPAMKSPLVIVLPDLLKYLTSGKTINDFLEEKKYDEEAFLKALHFLLIQGILGWGEVTGKTSLEDKKNLLNKIKTQFANKKDWEIYDIMVQLVSGKANKPDAVLIDFTKMLGRKPDSKEINLSVTHAEVTKIGERAILFVKSGGYAKVKEEADKAIVEKQIKLVQILEEARNSLLASNFKHALILLAKIKEEEGHVPGLRPLWCWAKLANINSAAPGAKEAVLKAVDLELVQITPEEKLEALYPFIQGMAAKVKADGNSARRFFQKAVSLDPNFIAAKRELALLQAKPVKAENVFEQDLKEVFTSLFKKKSG